MHLVFRADIKTELDTRIDFLCNSDHGSLTFIFDSPECLLNIRRYFEDLSIFFKTNQITNSEILSQIFRKTNQSSGYVVRCHQIEET